MTDRSYSKEAQVGQKRTKQDRATDRSEYDYVERRATVRGRVFCDWCGREIARRHDVHRHHVRPRSLGGPTHRSNLAIVHGDFTDEQCHLTIHKQGAPGWPEFRHHYPEDGAGQYDATLHGIVGNT